MEKLQEALELMADVQKLVDDYPHLYDAAVELSKLIKEELE